MTPVADDCVGVALLVDGGGDFDDLLAGFPRLRERLAGAPRRAVLGAGPAAAARRAAGWPAGCCWWATPPATSTR